MYVPLRIGRGISNIVIMQGHLSCHGSSCSVSITLLVRSSGEYQIPAVGTVILAPWSYDCHLSHARIRILALNSAHYEIFASKGMAARKVQTASQLKSKNLPLGRKNQCARRIFRVQQITAPVITFQPELAVRCPVVWQPLICLLRMMLIRRSTAFRLAKT